MTSLMSEFDKIKMQTDVGISTGGLRIWDGIAKLSSNILDTTIRQKGQ